MPPHIRQRGPWHPGSMRSQPAQQALTLLRQAHAAAASVQKSDWEFALSIVGLNRLGIDETTIRLLLASGLAECRVERITPETQQRTLLTLGNLALPEGACLIVTQAGLDCDDEQPARLEPVVMPSNAHCPPAAALSPTPQTPHWDRKRTLWWGDQAIKHLRRDAKPQRLILDAFQETRWQHHILDSLPPNGRTESKERLRQIVRHLNEHHQIAVMHFRVDEEGVGIYWGQI